MSKIKKYKTAIGRFLAGESGQRFFNFAYSIGAAIVIWGALFKILHLPGGNLLLCIGMGTEVLMFILTAFDRPAKQYHWEEVFPVLDTHAEEDRPDLHGGGGIVINSQPNQPGQPNQTSQTGQTSQTSPTSPTGQITAFDSFSPEAAEATTSYVSQISALSEQLAQLRQATEELNQVSAILLNSYRAITENSDRITASSTGYVDEMTSLNRNIAGLNTIYEIQLKSVSSQLDSIDRVNRGIKDIRDMYEKSAETSQKYCEETEKMAQYMQQLNAIYAKMIEAMSTQVKN
ncbi:MAG: gliding motility protein GldL [Muribaculaceae bacterium]|nr:gliding motility protein GldL [Muribaculaceae bacterium]